MAYTTHRLGLPSATVINVWAKATTTDEVKLEVKLFGASTWTLADTVTADATREHTAILAATGLVAGTRYDYHILINDVEAVANDTWTMPTTGRFLVYHLSDMHVIPAAPAAIEEAATAILDDLDTNHANTPAFVISTGDFTTHAGMSGATTVTQYVDRVCNLLIDVNEDAATPELFERLPFVYIWDDHDWNGDNSSATQGIKTLSVTQDSQDALWRDYRRSGNDKTEDYGYSFEVAGCPFIVTDQRSQKLITGDTGFVTGYQGAEDPSLTGRWFGHGSDQAAWISLQLRTYADRGQVFYISPTSFCDLNRLSNHTGAQPGNRDGISVWHKGEQVRILKDGCISPSYKQSRKLIILSGDDHSSTARALSVGIPYDNPDFTSGVTQIGKSIDISFFEFKVGSGSASVADGRFPDDADPGVHYWQLTQTGAHTPPTSGTEQLIRFDITSTESGKFITVHATYFYVQDLVNIGDAITDAAGRLGDFWLENGMWVYYSDGAQAGANALQSQTFPALSMPSPAPPATETFDFQDVSLDAISGLPVRHSHMKLDYLERARLASDLDQPDHQWHKRNSGRDYQQLVKHPLPEPDTLADVDEDGWSPQGASGKRKTS